MISKDLLAILCCPESHQPLTPAAAETLAALNDRIAAGTVKNRQDQPVTESIEEGLVREDGKFLYPVRNGIPVLLIEEGIALAP